MNQPDNRQRWLRALGHVEGTLSLLLQIILAVVAVGVFAGTVCIMVSMDESSKSQGGRVYIAVAALVALGAVTTKFMGATSRRRPSGEPSWRHALSGLLLMLFLAVVLMGLALFLP